MPAGDLLVALPLDSAREVVAEPAVTPLPTAPPAVLGLMDLRGEIIPLFDIAVLLNAGASAPSFVAVVQCERGLAGIATRGPLATVTLTDDLEPSQHGGVLGTAHLPEQVDAAVLDLDGLLSPS